MSKPEIAVFAPNPLLTVTIEREGAERDSIHFHAGGQGVWVAQMAATMGAAPTLCGLLGGESGELLGPLLARALGTTHVRLVRTSQRERLLPRRPPLRRAGARWRWASASRRLVTSSTSSSRPRARGH